MKLNLTSAQILTAIHGEALHEKVLHAHEILVDCVSTDTRRLLKNDLYIPLTGKNFNGHDFIEEAILKGCVGVVLSNRQLGEQILKKYPQLWIAYVSDTGRALLDLARYHRQRFNVPVIGITGSNGKTTTKEMLASLLSGFGPTLKTEGNLNNLVGVPLTLLEILPTHQFVVIEMGMNAPGEIKQLTQTALPTVGLITNVGVAHLEGLKTIEGIAKAKGELFLEISESATVLVNDDDAHVRSLPVRAKHSYRYGSKPEVDVRLLQWQPQDSLMTISFCVAGQNYESQFAWIGAHYALNFVACMAVAYALHLDIKKSAQCLSERAQFRKGRGEEHRLHNGVLILDETYNANPDSMQKAFETLAIRFPARRKIVVLGEMAELGEESKQWHRHVGVVAREASMNELWAIGESGEAYAEGFGKNAKIFKTIEELIESLKKNILAEDVVMVKGSRKSSMERVVQAFL